MESLKEIYQRNIYGVMATLIFHIVILLLLIINHINTRDTFIEQPLLIELNAPPVQNPETVKEDNKKQANGTDASTLSSSRGEQASNNAVNDASKATSHSKDPFFDKNYDKEIAAAKQLVKDVNKTLSQEIPKIGDVSMPVENAEGKTREEVQQSNFKGKSNIHYYLENRYHARLPIPIYLAEGGGEVTVDIIVGRDGRVISANPRSNPKIADLNLLAYAQQAAEKTVFNNDPAAPEQQKGTITYRFIAQ